MLGRAERAHVSTGTGSVALHPAFLTTKTKLLVLSQRQTQSVSKIDCLNKPNSKSNTDLGYNEDYL